MEYSVLLVLGVLSVQSTVYSNSLSPAHCSDDLSSAWPTDVRPEDLSLKPNNQDEKAIYRLSGQDGPHTAAGEQLKLKLSSSGRTIHRFLISALANEDSKCGPGRLRSREGSEPISYNCPNFLKEKYPTYNTTSIEFGWTAPTCGCVEIKAEILDDENNLFTFKDDTKNKLRYLACVNAVADVDYKDIDNVVDDESLELDGAEEESDDLSLDAYVDTVGVVKRQQKKATKAIKKAKKKERRQLAHGKRWCCRQGKLENKKNVDNVCGQETPTQVLEFASFKFGIEKDVCENAFTRCCSNGNLRRKSLKKKMKKVQKKKLKKILQKRRNKKISRNHKNA